MRGIGSRKAESDRALRAGQRLRELRAEGDLPALARRDDGQDFIKECEHRHAPTVDDPHGLGRRRQGGLGHHACPAGIARNGLPVGAHVDWLRGALGQPRFALEVGHASIPLGLEDGLLHKPRWAAQAKFLAVQHQVMREAIGPSCVVAACVRHTTDHVPPHAVHVDENVAQGWDGLVTVVGHAVDADRLEPLHEQGRHRIGHLHDARSARAGLQPLGCRRVEQLLCHGVTVVRGS